MLNPTGSDDLSRFVLRSFVDHQPFHAVKPFNLVRQLRQRNDGHRGERA